MKRYYVRYDYGYSKVFDGGATEIFCVENLYHLKNILDKFLIDPKEIEELVDVDWKELWLK